MAETVVAAIAEQLQCYRKLARLAELQHRHVQQSQTEELLDVLKSRQAILEQIGTLEQQLRPAKQSWSDFLASLPDADRSQAGAALAESRKLLEQITTSDQTDALVLQQRKLNIGKEIRRASTARQVNRNYAASAYGATPRPPRMDIQQ